MQEKEHAKARRNEEKKVGNKQMQVCLLFKMYLGAEKSSAKTARGAVSAIRQILQIRIPTWIRHLPLLTTTTTNNQVKQMATSKSKLAFKLALAATSGEMKGAGGRLIVWYFAKNKTKTTYNKAGYPVSRSSQLPVDPEL